ncbi:hypothetical protein CANMA_001006 [Candida margitis]|uniref:uncharacterized protein n=1 Tax=Candida margitis TaxID=1775924 RepID=UPI0022269217|nr:uncharacterized protein CANMA_001006 [Candida margitis]KAI5969966.1 hypothetical protein CANMA_001006 [Candida margitis]
MSKLDQILSFAEEIEARSNKLTDATSASIDLISHISYINQQLLQNDYDIDEIRHLMNTNQSCMIQLSALNEKSFYLESNLPINDCITNQTSFENLNTEYNHILSKLAANNQVSSDGDYEYEQDLASNLQQINIDDSYIDDESGEEDEEEDELDQEDYVNDAQLESTSPTLEPPDLKKMISISNLQLKPMRCASSSSTNATSQPRSISKKKSRYRLSSIYNINPVALEDSTIHSNTTSSFTSSSPPSEDSDKMMKNSLSQSFDTIESHFSIHHGPIDKDGQYNVNSQPNADDGQVGAALPQASPLMHNKHTRSNSLPTSSTKSIDQTELFKELDYQEDYLRFNRLKHFISISNLPKRAKNTTAMGGAQGLDEDDDDDLFYHEFEKSLTPQQCLDNCDVCSVISDISYYSPEKQGCIEEIANPQDSNLDFDTYNQFLRKSKLNLNEAYHNAFPHLYRQNKEDAGLDQQPQHQSPQQATQLHHPNHHFKNPIATIGSTTPHTVSPTLDTTFQQQQYHPVSTSQSSGKLSCKLLSQVISRSPATVTTTTVNRDAFATPSTSPKQSPTFLTSSPPLPIKSSSPASSKLNSMVTKSSPSTATSPSPLLFGSSSSPSFTHNLINFMSISKMHEHNQQRHSSQQLHHAQPFMKPPTPEKIRLLKKQKRLKRHVPISIPNEAQLKRIPPQLNHTNGSKSGSANVTRTGTSNSFRNEGGSFSKLTILRNQKYINHGDSSIFNNPIMRGCNEDAIREALSASLLE